jgi:adenylyl cyclase-associated protein
LTWRFDSSGETIHKEWQIVFINTLSELQKYVRKHFPQGLKWNTEGLPAESFIGTSSPSLVVSLAPNEPAIVPPAPTASSGGVPPPPPPPPPPPEFLMDSKSPSEKSSQSDMGAVFSQLNQGEGITKSLKHVDKSQMTHKNPALREKKTSPHLPPKPAALQRSSSNSPPSVSKSTGKKVLEGVKWVIV